MSVTDDVFFASDLPLDRIADQFSQLFRMELAQEDESTFLLGSAGYAGLPGITNTRLTENFHSDVDIEPDEAAVYDDCNALLSVRRPDKNLDLQHRAARAAFDTISQHLRWRAVLVHNLAFLVATWDPAHGLREYPPGTTPDAEDKALWS